MKLLLDTHVFLWFISADARLPATWRDAMQDPGNEVFLSVVSVWEAMVKYALGKLPLPHPPERYLPTTTYSSRCCSDTGLEKNLRYCTPVQYNRAYLVLGSRRSAERPCDAAVDLAPPIIWPRLHL